MKIPNFLKQIWHAAATLFTGMPAELRKSIAMAVKIAEAIKNFDDQNPEVADFAAAIIPGQADDRLIAYLRLQLPILLAKLKLVTAPKALSNSNTIIKNAVKNLNAMQKNEKDGFLHLIAVFISQELGAISGDTLTLTNAVFAVEWFYRNVFKQTLKPV